MKKKQRKQLDLFARTCVKFQFRILRIDKGSSNQVPPSNVSSPSVTTSKQEEFIVDSGASLQMMSEGDLNCSKVERSISYCDCNWNYSCD